MPAIPVKTELEEGIHVAYMSPVNFRPLYPAIASEIGEKSAPVVGLNDIFGSF
jgi:hypothetical protein